MYCTWPIEKSRAAGCLCSLTEQKGKKFCRRVGYKRRPFLNSTKFRQKSGPISSLPTKRSAAETKMNVKALLVFVLVLIVVSFTLLSEAFTAGGGGDIPGKIRRKGEYEVSSKNNYLFFSLGVSSKVSLERGSCSYISLLIVAQIICCKCSFS